MGIGRQGEFSLLISGEDPEDLTHCQIDTFFSFKMRNTCQNSQQMLPLPSYVSYLVLWPSVEAGSNPFVDEWHALLSLAFCFREHATALEASFAEM